MRPRSDLLTASALGVGATLLVLIATRHGTTVGPDSVTYLSAAHNLVHGRGVTDFTATPLTVFPPGYSAVLAAGEQLGASAISVGRFVNAISIGAIVVLTFMLVRRHVTSRLVVIGATALVALSPLMLRTGEGVASDVVFVALALAFLLVLEALYDNPGSVWLIVAAALLASAGLLVRYAGGALVIAGAITIAAVSKRDGLLTAIRRAAAFVVVAAVAPGLWLLRNVASDAPDALGLRTSSGDTPMSLVKRFLTASKHLVFPDGTPKVVPVGVALLVVVAVAAAAWMVRRELPAVVAGSAPALSPIIVFVVVYTAVVLGGRKTTGNDIEPRLLLPMWPALVVLGAWLVDRLMAAAAAGQRRALSRALGVSGAAVVFATAAWCAHQTADGADVYYRSADRAAIAVRHDVGQLAATDLVVSNDPWRTYFATGRLPTVLAPTPILLGFSHRPISTGDMARVRCARPILLIWYEASPATKDRPAASVTADRQLALSDPAPFDGGAAYRVDLGAEAHCPAPAN